MKNFTKHKKMKNTNKKLANKLKQNKGITLIALVITIIVLLILAGVSISAITGNESAMEKAKQARTANENADELDTIKLAIVEAVAAGYTGEIDGDVLAEKLTGIATVEPQITGGKVTSYKITGNKSHIIYEVQPNGSIEAKSGISFTGESTIIFTPGGETTAPLIATLSEDLSGTIEWSLADGTVSGSTSSNSVASITPLTGNTITVTKVGNSGQTTITASLPGTSYTATATVKIVEAVASVEISPDVLTVYTNQAAATNLSAVAKGASGNVTDATITYTVEPEGAVTVNNATGEVTGGENEATNVIIRAVATQGSTNVTSTNQCTVTVEENIPEPVLVDDTDAKLKTVSVTTFAALKNYDGYPDNKNLKAIKGEGASQQQIIVPKGFRVTEGKKLEDGIVIENTTDHNEFVWIPVGQTLKFTDNSTGSIALARRAFDSSGAVTTTDTVGSTAITFDSDSRYSTTETVGNTVATKTSDNTEIEAVKKARDNKGYYIGRYETGSGNVCQYNQTPWRKITRTNASNQAKGMYVSNTYLYKSDLVNSFAWDTAIYFIQQCGTASNHATYSRTIGQRKNGSDVANTGTGILNATSALDVQCNIYDMAGNVCEWTTERSSHSFYSCVFRGGRYNGTNYFTASRYFDYDNTPDYVGFRPLLYLNN